MAATMSAVSRQLLVDIATLRKEAIEDLGSMDESSYEEFSAKIAPIAKKVSLSNLSMVIGVQFKSEYQILSPNGQPYKEQVYLINSWEWENVKDLAKTHFESTPHVFVVDGNKFRTPFGTLRYKKL
jgi:hypothetical protein